MDARRIEEFRRRLREGGPVRVVNGHVLVGDPGKNPPAPAPAAAATQPGIEVKPHEWGLAVKPHAWGAELAPLYASPAGEARALKEQALLQAAFPGFHLDVDTDGVLYAQGALGPTPTLRGRYELLIEVPPGYGQGVMPRAHVLDPPLRAGAPHVFRDGALCLDHSGAFTARSTLVTFLAWVSVWLVLYEGWCDTGVGW